jgi:NAD(P)-dependent dehydrogenase (short-subunit alcohol dehydrogenase family)
VFDTNVKGVFFLTQRLLPLLEAARHRRPVAGDQHRLDRRHPHPDLRHPLVRSVEGGRARAHPADRLEARHAQHHRQRDRSRPVPHLDAVSTGVGTGGDVEGTDWDASAIATRAGRVGTPEDIAGLAIFLSSRAGAFTVGEVITCDGGTVVS